MKKKDIKTVKLYTDLSDNSSFVETIDLLGQPISEGKANLTEIFQMYLTLVNEDAISLNQESLHDQLVIMHG